MLRTQTNPYTPAPLKYCYYYFQFNEARFVFFSRARNSPASSSSSFASLWILFFSIDAFFLFYFFSVQLFCSFYPFCILTFSHNGNRCWCRRLIAKTRECVKKNMKIQEEEKRTNKYSVLSMKMDERTTQRMLGMKLEYANSGKYINNKYQQYSRWSNWKQKRITHQTESNEKVRARERIERKTIRKYCKCCTTHQRMNQMKEKKKEYRIDIFSSRLIPKNEVSLRKWLFVWNGVVENEAFYVPVVKTPTMTRTEIAREKKYSRYKCDSFRATSEQKINFSQ